MNHIAVITQDLDRFVEFYTDVLDLELVFTEQTPAFRHAIRARARPRGSTPPRSPTTRTVPRRRSCSTEAISTTSPSPRLMARRSPPTRKRLIARGASDGAVDDLARSTACGSPIPTACRSSSWSSSTTRSPASTNHVRSSRREEAGLSDRTRTHLVRSSALSTHDSIAPPSDASRSSVLSPAR